MAEDLEALDERLRRVVGTGAANEAGAAASASPVVRLSASEGEPGPCIRGAVPSSSSTASSPPGVSVMSGAASASCSVLVPGVSPGASSTTVVGMGAIAVAGVVGLGSSSSSLSPAPVPVFCSGGTMAISSGWASPCRSSWESVPEASPSAGSSSTFSTRVFGGSRTGEPSVGVSGADWASVN